MTLREYVEDFFKQKKHMKPIEYPPFDYDDPVKYEGDFNNGCVWYIYDGVGYMCKKKTTYKPKNPPMCRFITRETWFELY